MPPAPVCVCAICLAGTHEPNDLPLDERGTRLRRRMRVGLAKLYLIAMHNRNRKATHGQHLAGVRALQRFGDLINRRVLPCTAVTMREFIMHELATLKLDSSTVSAHVAGVSAWHAYVSDSVKLAFPDQDYRMPNPCKHELIRDLLAVARAVYKKASKATQALELGEARKMLASFSTSVPDQHRRLCIMLPLVAMLRQGATKRLIVRYKIVDEGAGHARQVHFLPGSDIWIEYEPDGRPYLCINVDTDKNIKAGGGRIAVVPCDIPALGIRPVDDVRSYILEARPPNGPAAGFFLSAPKSVKLMTFNSGMYTGFARVWRDTFRKLFPTALDRKIASHSGRKTLATLLWNDGYCRRFVADVGAWFCKSDAVDLYFATSRERILFALRHLGEGSGFSSRR